MTAIGTDCHQNRGTTRVGKTHRLRKSVEMTRDVLQIDISLGRPTLRCGEQSASRWPNCRCDTDEQVRIEPIVTATRTALACTRGQAATGKRRVADKGKPKTGKRCSFLGAHLDLIFCARFPPMAAYCNPRDCAKIHERTITIASRFAVPQPQIFLSYVSPVSVQSPFEFLSSNTVRSQSWKMRFRKAVERPL